MGTMIKVSCIDQALQLTNTPKVASGGVNEDFLHVDFCPMWDGYGKVAIFFRDRDTVYYMALDDAGECAVPHEVLTDAGKMYFAIYGTKDTSVRTSEVISYQIVDGAITSDTVAPAEPTQSVLDQVIQMIADKAPKVSPELTGTPTAPTAEKGTSTTQIATTAFVAEAVSDKAPIDSPALTGKPTAPTAAKGTNTTQIATTAFVAAAIAALIDSSPAALDTLNELAAALGNDPNFSATVMELIGQKAASTDLSAHTDDGDVHVTPEQKTAWTTHAARHAAGGEDAITPEALGAAAAEDIIGQLKYTAQTLTSEQQAQARANIGSNLQTFHTLEQLGLTQGEETLAAIYTALPVGGLLLLRVDTSCAAIYPATHGVFVAEKVDGYARLSFVSVSSTAGSAGASWAGSMYGADVFSGWRSLPYVRSMTRNTLSISNSSDSNSFYWKNDANEVGLIIKCKITSTLSTGTQIATLPAGYRPTATLLLPLSYKEQRSLRIYTDGKVDFSNGSIASGEFIGVSVVFPT